MQQRIQRHFDRVRNHPDHRVRKAVGIGLVIGGFVPSPLEEITAYHPSFQEIMITLGVWATGFFILTVLYKIALSVKEEKMIS